MENVQSNEHKYQYRMKWHNFLVYFFLLATAVVYFFSAMYSAFGWLIFADIRFLYKVRISLLVWDILNASMAIGIAVIAVFTWLHLKNFKAGASRWVLILCVAAAVWGAVYGFARYFIVSRYGIVQPVLQYTLWAVIMILTDKYYAKRDDLFIN